MKLRTLGLLTILAGGLAFGACAGDDSDDDDGTPTGTVTGTGTGSGAGGGGGSATGTGTGTGTGQGGAAPGDTCSDPIAITDDTVISGANIVADYNDDLDQQDESCDAGFGPPETGAVDFVAEVTLAAGESLTVVQVGGVDTVMTLASTCGNSAACLVAADEPEELLYTASSAETVYLVASTYDAVPSATDYEFQVTLSTCGDGVTEGAEGCDDIVGTPAPGDGCDAECQVEFGYECDTTAQPSSCTLLPLFATFDAHCESDVSGTYGAIAADEWETYRIDMDVGAVLKGHVTSPDGDVDVYIYNSDGEGYDFEAIGSETIEVFLEPREWLMYVYAAEAVTAHTLTLGTACPEDLPNQGNGGTVNEVEGSLALNASYYYLVTLDEDLMMTGTLTATSGNPNLYVYGTGGTVGAHFEPGGDLVGLGLKAGTYLLEVYAQGAVPDFTLSLSFATLAVPNIGSFAAAAAIPDTVGGPLTARHYDHRTITFTEPVLLSGTLSDTTGETGVRLYDAARSHVYSFYLDTDTLTSLPVPAGSYLVQILTISQNVHAAGGDVQQYTLSLSTTAPQ